MKLKGLVFVLLFFVSVSLASSAECTLTTSLISQDPYPAVPGDYVDLVFQVGGLENSECGLTKIELLPAYPFLTDPNQSTVYTANSGIFAVDFKSTFTAFYKMRVDNNAVDGFNSIDLSVTPKSDQSPSTPRIYTFNISVEDVRTDFEISIKDYVKSTNTLTFEILNIGEHDIEALTVEIPKQPNIEIKGANRNNIGSLDSNDDISFDFEAIPKNGEIKINILYTDSIGERRMLEKAISYDSDYFTGRARDAKTTPIWIYILIIAVIVVGILYWRRRKNKK